MLGAVGARRSVLLAIGLLAVCTFVLPGPLVALPARAGGVRHWAFGTGSDPGFADDRRGARGRPPRHVPGLHTGARSTWARVFGRSRRPGDHLRRVRPRRPLGRRRSPSSPRDRPGSRCRAGCRRAPRTRSSESGTGRPAAAEPPVWTVPPKIVRDHESTPRTFPSFRLDRAHRLRRLRGEARRGPARRRASAGLGAHRPGR
jgi:hypothetical protein